MALSLEQLLPILRCPATKSPLAFDGDDFLRTPDDARRYRIANGVPILIAPERSLFDPSAVVTRDASDNSDHRAQPVEAESVIKRWLICALNLPPTKSRNVAARDNYRLLQTMLRNRSRSVIRPVKVLVVGGGEVGVGAVEILSDPAFEVIETDVYMTRRTRVICDGHDLPFVDSSFDAVICQAVLEHVIDPWRVAAEIRRVLKPEGLVYSEIPFMQQVHLGAFDFTRFSLPGHRRLWRDFDEIRAGAQCGPGMALIWSALYFCRALLPVRVWSVSDRFVTLGLFWLKYMDGYLVRRPGGIDAASGTFFLGQRRAVPLDDRTIVRRYGGVGPRLD